MDAIDEWANELQRDLKREQERLSVATDDIRKRYLDDFERFEMEYECARARYVLSTHDIRLQLLKLRRQHLEVIGAQRLQVPIVVESSK